MQTWLTQTFNIKYPIIMAPMFLVSNKEMLVAASEAGITGCIPSLNYRTPEEFEAGLIELKRDSKQLIHQLSNYCKQPRLKLKKSYVSNSIFKF